MLRGRTLTWILGVREHFGHLCGRNFRLLGGGCSSFGVDPMTVFLASPGVHVALELIRPFELVRGGTRAEARDVDCADGGRGLEDLWLSFCRFGSGDVGVSFPDRDVVGGPITTCGRLDADVPADGGRRHVPSEGGLGVPIVALSSVLSFPIDKLRFLDASLLVDARLLSLSRGSSWFRRCGWRLGRARPTPGVSGERAD